MTVALLDKKVWRGEEEALWSVQIAEQVKARIKQEMRIPRYKIVVQAILGEMKDQGVRVASKCLWDADSDNYASYSYRNVRLLPVRLLPCLPTCTCLRQRGHALAHVCIVFVAALLGRCVLGPVGLTSPWWDFLPAPYPTNLLPNRSRCGAA